MRLANDPDMDEESLIMENAEEMETRLQALHEQGADGFDPVRFRHVTSLVRRSEKMRPSVRRKIEEKAQRLAKELSKRLDAAHAAVRAGMDRIRSKDPETAKKIRRLLEDGDFQALRKATRKPSNGANRRLFAGLIRELKKARENTSLNVDRLFMDRLLEDQEARIIGGYDASFLPGASTGDDHPAMLRSFALMRKNLARRNARQIVAEAVRNLPENPGHLNGQMISTRCLEAMESLSPAYLDRFIAFVHTLMRMKRVSGGQVKK